LASFYTFEIWVREQIDQLRRSLSRFCLESTLNNEIDSLRKYITLQERLISDYHESNRKKFMALESKIRALESKLGSSFEYERLERRIAALEAENLSSRMERLNTLDMGARAGLKSGDLEDKINLLESKINDLNPNKETMVVRFGNIWVNNLTRMKVFLEANISSLHFSLLADYHLLMEHINHNTNPSKPTLEHL